MKNAIVALFLLGSVALFLFGCQTAQQASLSDLSTSTTITPTTTASSTTTTFSEKVTSFLGISLGMHKSTVDSILGRPIQEFSSSDSYIYAYSSGEHTVFYNSDYKVTTIATTSSAYSLKDISVGNTSANVKTLLGDPSRIASYPLSYFWYYDRWNIAYRFDKSNDKCDSISIY